MSAAIAIHGLGRSFGSRRALDNLNFEVPRGKIVGLLGPNGCGKTTLFRVISTLILPDEGTALVQGSDVVRSPAEVRRRIGVVFQNPSLDKKLTAKENLLYQGQLYGLGGNELKERSDGLLRRLGLAERGNDLVETFSGGMARRVEIAKGLIHRPQIFLLDEPTTGLDPAARREVWALLEMLRTQDRMTMLFTTHMMEEAERADLLIIMDAGKVVAQGTPAALKAGIGGDVIRVESRDPHGDARDLCTAINQKFGGNATVVDNTVRVERPAGHEFVPQLVAAFPDRIAAVSVGKPTLDDVFIRHTGHGLYESEAVA